MAPSCPSHEPCGALLRLLLGAAAAGALLAVWVLLGALAIWSAFTG